MTYARQVVKEILRYRAPAPMVPLLAHKAFALTEDFTVPKGTLVMPSLHTACLQVISSCLQHTRISITQCSLKLCGRVHHLNPKFQARFPPKIHCLTPRFHILDPVTANWQVAVEAASCKLNFLLSNQVPANIFCNTCGLLPIVHMAEMCSRFRCQICQCYNQIFRLYAGFLRPAKIRPRQIQSWAPRGCQACQKFPAIWLWTSLLCG